MSFRHSVQRTLITQRGAAKLGHYRSLSYPAAQAVRDILMAL